MGLLVRLGISGDSRLRASGCDGSKSKATLDRIDEHIVESRCGKTAGKTVRVHWVVYIEEMEQPESETGAAVASCQHPSRAKNPARLSQHPVLSLRGRYVVQHGAADHRAEGCVREGHGGGVSGLHPHATPITTAKKLGRLRIDLQGREIGGAEAYECFRDQTGTWPDLENRSVEVHVLEDPRENLVDHQFAPLLGVAIALVEQIHTVDDTTAHNCGV
ncbi:MAG: hypothetical protein BMS9Abin12_1259 [Acidimicrobiia bacterium]|nr:MAG: hypothetical protein BMS9Abin12_1259 [Acidimicrobiia bacterium]